MLLGSPWELGRTDEEDVADTALGREFTAWRLALRTSVEDVLWLSVTRANERSRVDLLLWEAYLNPWASLNFLNLTVNLNDLSGVRLTWHDEPFKQLWEMFFVFCKEEVAFRLPASMLEDVNCRGEADDGDLNLFFDNFAYRLEDVTGIAVCQTRKHYQHFFSPVGGEWSEIIAG